MTTTRTAKPARKTFEIATAGGKDTAEGWVLGGFAARKGRYFWEFTDLSHGMRISTYPCVETKAAAFEHLAKLNDPSSAPATELRKTTDFLKSKGLL